MRGGNHSNDDVEGGVETVRRGDVQHEFVDEGAEHGSGAEDLKTQDELAMGIMRRAKFCAGGTGPEN